MYDKNNRSLFEKEGYQPLADRIRPYVLMILIIFTGKHILLAKTKFFQKLLNKIISPQ